MVGVSVATGRVVRRQDVGVFLAQNRGESLRRPPRRRPWRTAEVGVRRTRRVRSRRSRAARPADSRSPWPRRSARRAGGRPATGRRARSVGGEAGLPRRRHDEDDPVAVGDRLRQRAGRQQSLVVGMRVERDDDEVAGWSPAELNGGRLVSRRRGSPAVAAPAEPRRLTGRWLAAARWRRGVQHLGPLQHARPAQPGAGRRGCVPRSGSRVWRSCASAVSAWTISLSLPVRKPSPRR